MAAALTHPVHAVRSGGYLRPIRPVQDLADIADLTEIGFGEQLGSAGLAVVREMRDLASLGLMLWPISWGLRLSLGAGFVWEEAGHVVGNVSLFDAGGFPHLGRGWLIANVVVHPDFRRRGIGRALVEAALRETCRRRGRWAALQVDRANAGAYTLYESLGFENRGTLMRWEGTLLSDNLSPDASCWFPRGRRLDEVDIEVALVMQARPAMLIWSRPLTWGELRGGWLWLAGRALTGLQHERWVLDAPDCPGEGLLGSAWVEMSLGGETRISLFYARSLCHPEARQALVRFALSRIQSKRGSRVAVEHLGDDPPIEQKLREMGFRLERELVQMWHSLELEG